MMRRLLPVNALAALLLSAALPAAAQLYSTESLRSSGSSNQTDTTGNRSSDNSRSVQAPTGIGTGVGNGINAVPLTDSDTRNVQGTMPRSSSPAGPRDGQQTQFSRGDANDPRTPRSTEFSRYASRLAGQTLNVFGAEFFRRQPGSDLAGGPPAVPADYLVNVGDELLVQLSGTIEGEFRQVVRRGGEITLPRVGTLRVAGTPAGDLAASIRRRLESQLRNVDVAVSFLSLRGMRVFVTGFVESPGAHVIDSLSTVSNALYAAGGPAEGGSYRVAELWRGGKKVASFDLYALLIRGDRTADLPLTAEDVIRVAPAGRYQVGITGSINRPGVYELLPGEGLSELLEYCGGYNPIADRRRLGAVTIDESGRRSLAELPSEGVPGKGPLSDGVVLHVFSSAQMAQGINSSRKIVHVEGEVQRPGSYVLPAASSVQDALEAAGGVTADAFLPRLTLVRPSLAREQELLLNRSLDELERSVFEASATVAAHSGESGQAQAQAAASTRTYIDRLRQFKPSGRLIIPKSQQAGAMQPLLLDGDRLLVPPRPIAVSIFGAVYGEGTYLARQSLTLGEVLEAAGGVRPGADRSGIVVLKADGSYRAAQASWYRSNEGVLVEPGDSVFVPTDTQRGSNWNLAKDIATLFYQFGLGAAAIKALN